MTTPEELSNNLLNSDAINDDFFIEVAANKLNLSKDQFKLRLVLLSPATGKNENYMSVLYRAKIKIEILETQEQKTVDAFIKALISTVKEVKEFGVFPRESFMYENVLCSFEKIWLEEAGEKVQIGPKFLKIETDPYEIIVLEDLKAENFKIMDRKIGFDLKQTKMLLTKFSQFHAASAVRFQRVWK
jgi:hypothetical protein